VTAPNFCANFTRFHAAAGNTATPATAIAAAAQSLRPRSDQVEHPHKRQLSHQLPHIRSPISFKYRLELRWPPQDVGTAVLEVRMTGDLVLMTKKSHPATYFTSRGETDIK
jgi:hypothetical protein